MNSSTQLRPKLQDDFCMLQLQFNTAQRGWFNKKVPELYRFAAVHSSMQLLYTWYACNRKNAEKRNNIVDKTIGESQRMWVQSASIENRRLTELSCQVYTACCARGYMYNKSNTQTLTYN